MFFFFFEEPDTSLRTMALSTSQTTTAAGEDLVKVKGILSLSEINTFSVFPYVCLANYPTKSLSPTRI